MMLVVLPGERAEERMLAMEKGVPVVSNLRERTRKQVLARRTSEGRDGKVLMQSADGKMVVSQSGRKRPRKAGSRASVSTSASMPVSVPACFCGCVYLCLCA